METKTTIALPILPLKDPDLVVFPGLYCEIDVGREFSICAVESSIAHYENKIIIGIQTDNNKDTLSAKDFQGICTEAEIKSVVREENGNKLRLIIIGTKRGLLRTVGESDGEFAYLYGDIEYIEEPEVEITDDIRKVIPNLKSTIKKFLPDITIEDKNINTSQELSLFVDGIVGQLPIPGKKKLKFLRMQDAKKRLNELCIVIGDLIKKSRGDESYKKEQKEDDMDSPNYIANEISRLKKEIDVSGMSEETLKVAKQELKRLGIMTPSSSEFQVTFNYLDTLVSLPWNKFTEDNLDIENAKKILDEDHYGLEKVKERILEFLAVKKMAPDKNGSILCFVGPPGIGKTSIAKSIARAIGRKCIRISIGNINDSAEIRGHRRTYVGAMMGRIMTSMKKAGSSNPVFILDEIDKIGGETTIHGNVSAAMLEVLDPEQNYSFADHYLGVPFDLSKIMFICTANDLSRTYPALKDRMEIIEIPSYTLFEKTKIAQNHLIRKQQIENGLKDYNIEFCEDAITKIIEEYTRESGVRSLERECATVMRKIAVSIASGKEKLEKVSYDMIPKFLGKPKTFSDERLANPEIGTSTGLAWTPVGGSILFIETVLFPGKGDIKLTGNLGKIIQESANIMHTWIKANAENLNIDKEKINKFDIHVHFPENSVGKEGASAGSAICCSMVSAYSKKLINPEIAMTGEMTLRGRILPVGGIREKVMAAFRAGIKHVILPEKNIRDIEEIPKEVKDLMKFTLVSNINEVLDIIFLDNVKDMGDNNIMNISKKSELINIGA